MNKKGFTLVELLAVIIIISIVFSIGYASLDNLQEAIDASILSSKYETFEEAALSWGNDNLVIFTDGVSKNVEVESLISQGYLTATDICTDSSGTEYDCIKDPDGNDLNNTKIEVLLDSGALSASVIY